MRIIEDINLFCLFLITRRKTFTVIESDVSLDATRIPISSENAVVASIFPDKERGCLWITLAKQHPIVNISSRDSSLNFQFWQYFPDSNTFHGVSSSCVVMPDSRLIGFFIADMGKLFLFSPETASYTEFPTRIKGSEISCIAATWLGDNILYSAYPVSSFRLIPYHLKEALYLYRPGDKASILLNSVPDDLIHLEISLLVTTDYGVLAMGRGGAFLINPKTNKE